MSEIMIEPSVYQVRITRNGILTQTCRLKASFAAYIDVNKGAWHSAE